ncbi:MAG: hypothetical protein AB1757_16575 [Acidobacteriota bacterium]
MIATSELELEVEPLLEERAKADGCDVQSYVKQLVKNDTFRQQTFDEILAPIRKTFQESGMSEDELMMLFEEARDEVYQERRAKER